MNFSISSLLWREGTAESQELPPYMHSVAEQLTSGPQPSLDSICLLVNIHGHCRGILLSLLVSMTFFFQLS